MSSPMNANAVLEREFLKTRAKILEVAAILDRIDRADGDVRDDPRHAQLRRGMEALLADEPDRAERLQLIFSLPYQEDWRRQFELE